MIVDDRIYEFRGLSTDTKPTNVARKSVFIEMDTSKSYVFNGTEWIEGSSGGGGTSVEANPELLPTDKETLHSIRINSTKYKVQDVLVAGENIKTLNGNSILGSGDMIIGGGCDKPLTYNIIDESTPQTIILASGSVTIFRSKDLESITVNFEEDYDTDDNVGWYSEIIFRNDSNVNLIINNNKVKYIQFGRRVESFNNLTLSTNASIDMIFFYDGIDTLCYVSEVVDKVGE